MVPIDLEESMIEEKKSWQQGNQRGTKENNEEEYAEEKMDQIDRSDTMKNFSVVNGIDKLYY